MTATPPAAPSATPPAALDPERSDLLAALATARTALTAPARGLTDEQAGARPTVSALCLGGLIKHVASMEEQWTRFAVEGPSAMPHDLPDGVTWDDFLAGTAREFPQWAIDHQREFEMQPGDTLSGILRRYEEVAARTEEIIAAVPDLSAAHPLPAAPWHEPGGVRSVRQVLTHLIAETAQHAGHADILRETLDQQNQNSGDQAPDTPPTR
ncbi:DinB family protein [Streptomyces sp. NPDC091292]|uniref:DinB family protein n=1 Tax=Streptomyces sp. NPDC091292 TaxID=3365991 RepID=UPI0037F91D71